MSSFFTRAVNKETGRIVDVVCHDGYFGQHEYGYELGEQPEVLNAEQFNKLYEVMK